MVGDQFGVTQAAVSKVFWEVTEELYAKRNDFICMPTDDEIDEVK